MTSQAGAIHLKSEVLSYESNDTFTDSLAQWFLTCGELPTGGEWRSCQVGNDRSDSRTTASKTTASKYLRTKHFMG